MPYKSTLTSSRRCMLGFCACKCVLAFVCVRVCVRLKSLSTSPLPSSLPPNEGARLYALSRHGADKVRVQSNDSMYKTLQDAAAQENAYKSMMADLNNRLAMMEEANTKAHNNKPLAEAHAALDTILSAEWATAPAGKLPSIAETLDEDDSSAKVIQLGHPGAVASAGPSSPAARVLELQRQVPFLFLSLHARLIEGGRNGWMDTSMNLSEWP